jgi:PPE-repeat protein
MKQKYESQLRHSNTLFRKLLRRMKITAILLLISLSHVMAKSYAQTVQLSVNYQNTKIDKVFEDLEQKTSFSFLYREADLDSEKAITYRANNQELFQILEDVLNNSNLQYKINDQLVIILPSKDQNNRQANQAFKVKGKVTDMHGEPLPGVNVFEQQIPTNGVITNINGEYEISLSSSDALIVFSYIGFEKQEIQTSGRKTIDIVLLDESTGLNEVVVTALGMKREKKALGYAMQQLSADELNTTSDPSINSALQGKVAGVQIDGGAGGVGSSTKITIRGNSSIRRSNEPLWIVDGVPINDESNGEAGEFC